jgi:hypothetical protein
VSTRSGERVWNVCVNGLFSVVRVALHAIAGRHLYNAHDYFHLGAGEGCSLQFSPVGLSGSNEDNARSR